MMSNIQNMKILLINANTTLVNAFAKFLRIKGFFVITESSLKAGLRRLKKEHCDVVFVDAPLEDYNETQLLFHFQENNIFQKTNVLLFSYLDFDNLELSKWKNHGLYSYLKKPVKRSVILKTLDDLHFKINSDNSQNLSESKPKDEEATPEQLARLKQLEKQIQELESQPAPESATQPELKDEEATPEQLARLKQLEKQIQELESQPAPESATQPELKDEEATPEQLARLKQLEKQIQELESQPAPESATQPELKDEEATPEQLARLKQLEKQIQELESQPAPESATQPELKDEEATPEQLARLKQLEKQIQELGHITHQSIHDEKDQKIKNSPNVKQNSSGNISSLQKIIHDLNSLSSRFNSVRHNPTINVKTA